MTREDQQELVAVIRGVHEKLRLDYQTNGDGDQVWRDHCQDRETRRKYAESMLQLATTVWPYRDRIEWCYQTLRSYFFEGGLEHSLRRHYRKMGLPCSDFELEQARRQLVLMSGKVRLLDVGSCYNPFGAYDDIDSLAVDLTPATQDVIECDFLKLRVVPGPVEVDDLATPLEALQEGSFEAVVFCLVLEYLPSCVQRWSFCRKAAALLRTNGLLFIVTPDSKHQQRNAAMIASWRKALEHIGLLRIRYEKRQHLHCMAFRKAGRQTTGLGADDVLVRGPETELRADKVHMENTKQVESACNAGPDADREVLRKACVRKSVEDSEVRLSKVETADSDLGRELAVAEEEDIAQLMYIPQDSRDYVALFSKSVSEDRTGVEDESLRDVFMELPDCEDL